MLRNTRATLMIDDEPVRDELGEVTISDRGLEGAVILRLSRAAVDGIIDGRKVVISLDLKPGTYT